MTKILVPGQNTPLIDPKNPLKRQPVNATPVFQNETYTILRHTGVITVKDMLDLPLHMIQIALALINAEAYIPKIGKASFVHTMKQLKRSFTKECAVQLAKARSMVDKEDSPRA